MRCGKCHKLLAIGQATAITIKCPRCGTMNHLRALSPSSEPPDGRKLERDA